MSRIGKQPVLIPGGVTAEVSGQTVTIKGAKGECSYTSPNCIKIAAEEDDLVTYPSLALDSNENTHISYCDFGEGDLKYV